MPTSRQEPREGPTGLGRGGWLAALKRVRPRIKPLNLGLLAVLGRLRATADWGSIMHELWPADGASS